MYILTGTLLYRGKFYHSGDTIDVPAAMVEKFPGLFDGDVPEKPTKAKGKPAQATEPEPNGQLKVGGTD